MKSPKVTKQDQVHGRWYEDACGAAFAMELIGERWSLPVVRELMLGGRRFSDIRASLPGISAKVLTERLASLEAAGIVQRVTLGSPAPARLYALTQWGLGLETVMQALGRWSVQSPCHNPALPLTSVSMMLSLRTMIAPERIGDWRTAVRFEVGRDRFIGRLGDGALKIEREDDDSAPADITFRAPDANAYLWVFYGKQPIGGPGIVLEAQGEPEQVQRFVDLFALPPKLSTAA